VLSCSACRAAEAKRGAVHNELDLADGRKLRSVHELCELRKWCPPRWINNAFRLDAEDQGLEPAVGSDTREQALKLRSDGHLG
jgi:hypothetical protein